MTTYYDLAPLTLEHIAAIWWRSADYDDPQSWDSVAGWCYGAYSVACTPSDRSDWDLLRAIAWDHAGYCRPALKEAVA